MVPSGVIVASRRQRKQQMNKIYRATASWCGPCKSLAKVLDTINLDVPIEVVDIDENQEFAEKFGIRNVPVLIGMEDDKEVSRLIGLNSAEQIRDWVTLN